MKFSFKKNIIIIVAAAILAISAGVGAVAIGVSSMPASRVSRYMGAAERYLSEFNYEQAIIEFDRILEIDPMNVDAYLGKAQAYLALGDTENALKWLEKGFEMTGDERLQGKIDEINRSLEPPKSSATAVSSSSIERSSSISRSSTSPSSSSSSSSTSSSSSNITTSFSTSSEPEEIPQYEHDDEYYEVVNMLQNYFNGTGTVDPDLLKSIKVFGVKPNGFDVVVQSEDYNRLEIDSDEPYKINNNECLTAYPLNSFKKMNIISDMTNCYDFFVDGFTINDYSIFPNIKYMRLHLYNCEITNVTQISKLNNLSNLDLRNNQISDISPLANLTNLSSLYLGNNQISNLLPLANLTNLKILWLSDNKISNISSLTNLKNLKCLYLWGNQISDISVLANLTNLKTLYLYNNQITDISPLENLTNLESLYLSGNPISDTDIERLKQQLPNCKIYF